MTNFNTIKLEFKVIKGKKVEANFKGGLITSVSLLNQELFGIILDDNKKERRIRLCTRYHQV